MANALKFKTTNGAVKVYGLAQIKVGQDAVRITFLDKQTGQPSEAKDQSIRFDKDDLPKRPVLATKDDSGLYMVVLSPEKDEVEKIGPSEGHFFAKCVDFARTEEGADPEPKERTSNYQGKETTYLTFTPIFEIQKGKYKGLQIPHFLRYKFASDGDGHAMFDGDPSNPKAVHLPKLLEFCEKTGCIETPIEWPEDGNILPELLARILRADKMVDLTIQKGYIQNILSADYEEEEEAPKAKSNGGKAKKVVEPEDDPDDDL